MHLHIHIHVDNVDIIHVHIESLHKSFVRQSTRPSLSGEQPDLPGPSGRGLGCHSGSARRSVQIHTHCINTHLEFFFISTI